MSEDKQIKLSTVAEGIAGPYDDVCRAFLDELAHRRDSDLLPELGSMNARLKELWRVVVEEHIPLGKKADDLAREWVPVATIRGHFEQNDLSVDVLTEAANLLERKGAFVWQDEELDSAASAESARRLYNELTHD